MTSKNLLSESMHSLITPEFSGTHEEMIAAVNYWVGIVSQLRILFTIVPSQNNRDAILKQLMVELAGLNSELNNNTASVAPNPYGLNSMDQVLTTPELPAEVEIDLSISNESLNKLRENAGIKLKQITPLQKVFSK